MITTTEKVRGERILNNTTMSKKKKEQIEGTFFFGEIYSLCSIDL